MGVWLSLKSLKRDSSELVILNDMQASTGFTVQAGMDWGSVLNPGIFSSSIDTEGGSKVAERVENRVIQLQIVCGMGDTLSSVKTAWQSLEAMIMEVNKYKGLLRFRSSQYSYGVTFEVEHIDVAQVWSKPAELGGHIIPTLSLTCKPFALMDAMDIEDSFTQNTIGVDGAYNNGGSDWSVDAGALTNVAISSGVLAGSANLSTENRLIHTGTPYEISDVEVLISFTPGSTITSFKAGTIIKRIDASNYLEAYIDDNGVNSRIRIDKIVAGSRTNLSSTNLTSRVSSSVRVWLAGRIERNIVYANVFTETNFKTGYIPAGASDNDVSYTLTTSEADIFGQTIDGRSGIVFTPQHAAAKIHDVKILPFTYRTTTTRFHPDADILQTTIPGSVPALVDVSLASYDSGGYSSGTQCLLAWGKRPTPVNMIWNSGFSDSTSTNIGWNVSAVTGFNGAGSSISIGNSSSSALDGNNYGIVVTTATSGSGTNFPIYRMLRKGVTYTFSVYLKAPTSTTSMVIKLGTSASSTTSSASALTTSWQQYTVSHTPTTDSYSPVYVSIQTNSATTTTFWIDRAVLVEDDNAPTSYAVEDADDRYPGGFTVLERIHAGNMFAPTGGAGSITMTIDSSAIHGYIGEVTATTTTMCVPVMIETGLELVSVYARVKLSSGTTTASIIPSLAGGGNSTTSYTLEFGSSGANIINSKPSSSTTYVNVFLGTFAIGKSLAAMQRFRLNLTMNYTGTVPGLEYVVLVPADTKAATIHKQSGAATSLPSLITSSSTTTFLESGSVVRETYQSSSGYSWIRNKYFVNGLLLGSGARVPANSEAQFFVLPSVASVSHDTPSSSDSAYPSGGHYLSTHYRVTPRVLMVGD